DNDFFWHLKVGQQLQRDGVGPLVDDISFASSKEPWTPYSWLAELAMKRIWDAGGLRAAVIAQALLNAALVLAMLWAAVEASRDASRYVPALIATAAMAF